MLIILIENHKRHVFTILIEYFEYGMRYDNLLTEDLPWKLLCPHNIWNQTENTHLIGAKSAFNCIYLHHFFRSSRNVLKWPSQNAFQNLSQIKIF